MQTESRLLNAMDHDYWGDCPAWQVAVKHDLFYLQIAT
jgi:hypothetical protein